MSWRTIKGRVEDLIDAPDCLAGDVLSVVIGLPVLVLVICSVPIWFPLLMLYGLYQAIRYLVTGNDNGIF